MLMLDELDALNSVADDLETVERFFAYLRSLVERNRDIFFILSSCADVRWDADPGMARLLTLAVDHLSVDLLSEPETLELIVDPVEEYFVYSEDALSEIVELSGCHPCFTQLICRQVVDWRNHQEVNEVSLKVLDETSLEAVARGHLHFEDLWRGLSHNERSILVALSRVLERADRVNRQAIELELQALHQHVGNWDVAVDRLEHKGLVELRDGFVRLRLGLLRHWIRRTPLNTLLDYPEARPSLGGMQ